jgi:thioesterase domain-containing protein/acyl carrier protein
MIPGTFVMLEVLPLTPNGKVNRRALPAPEQVRQDLETTFVVPRNEVERQLAQIWEEVLGVKPVSVTDNFFDLGGHSLLAVKVFAQIEHKFAEKLPLAILFQAGTIESLANIISQSQEEKVVYQASVTKHEEDKAADSWSSLVAIQPKGSKPPLFCIHPLGGEILCYRPLALHLGTDQPFYGLQPRGLDGTQPPLTRIEDMAAFYIKEIQTIQPNGPYFLGGFSMGGVIACEMSLQLQRQGHKVGLLVILDSGLPGSLKRVPFIQRIFLHICNLIQRGPSYLRKKLVGWSEWSKYQIRERYMHLLGISEALPEGDKHISIVGTNIQALEAYTLQTYPGQITLFRTDENSDDSQDHAVGIKSEPLLGWDKVVTGGIDLHYIPGSHTTLFDEPHVRGLADKLKECLKKAYTNS